MTTRRVFLTTLGAWSAAGCLGCESDGVGADGISDDVKAGSASAVRLGSLEPVDGYPVALGRDERGIYALSLICTHERCDMSVDGTVSSSGVYCSCHGSKFDAQGKVQRGPARSPLTHYAVSKDDAGNLTIHGAEEVTADTRLVV